MRSRSFLLRACAIFFLLTIVAAATLVAVGNQRPNISGPKGPGTQGGTGLPPTLGI